MATFLALAHLIAVSARRQLRSKKMLLGLGLLLAMLLVVSSVGTLRTWSAQGFGQHVVLRLVGLFFLPSIALIFGTGALGDEREEKTLSYLLTRPLPRWGIYVSKWLSVVPWTLALTVGGLWLLHRVAILYGRPELRGTLGMFLPAVFWGSLAYLALFHFLGALFRHSTVIAIAYVFFVEVFLGRVPGILKRVSISFYTWSSVYDEAAAVGVHPSSRAMFLPVSGETAESVLAGVAIAFVLLGAVLFARREYAASD